MTSRARETAWTSRRAAWVLPPILVTVVLDRLTKMWVLGHMTLYEQRPLLGDFLRLTYTQNRGAAFGINAGEHSRIVFAVLSMFAIAVLVLLYRRTPTTDRFRLLALSFVMGGALGNFWDRIHFPRGVVDFVDVGIGAHRFYIFNVADSAITVGALLLMISFFREERAGSGSDAAPDSPAGPAPPSGSNS